MKDRETAILISTYDPYFEALDISLKMFEKYWKDLNYEIIVANNEMEIKNHDIKLINCGNDAKSWCKRALMAVNQTNAEYYLIIMEDIFISKPVDNDEIKRIISFMKKNKIDFYKLIPTPYPKGELFEGEKHIHKLNKQTAYGININTAIFSREFLLKCLGDGEISAWDLEEKFLKEASVAPNEYFDNCACDDRNVLNTIHGIIQGKWLGKTVKTLKKEGIFVDTKKRGIYPVSSIIKSNLFKFSRSVLSPKAAVKIKKIMSKLGFKFVTKY